MKPEKALKRRTSGQNLGSLHRIKQKLTRYARLTVKSCFVKEQASLLLNTT